MPGSPNLPFASHLRGVPTSFLLRILRAHTLAHLYIHIRMDSNVPVYHRELIHRNPPTSLIDTTLPARRSDSVQVLLVLLFYLPSDNVQHRILQSYPPHTDSNSIYSIEEPNDLSVHVLVVLVFFFHDLFQNIPPPLPDRNC